MVNAAEDMLQAAKRQRDSDGEDDDESDEEEERPKMSNRAAALAASKSRPAELVTSKRVLLPSQKLRVSKPRDFEHISSSCSRTSSCNMTRLNSTTRP